MIMPRFYKTQKDNIEKRHHCDDICGVTVLCDLWNSTANLKMYCNFGYDRVDRVYLSLISKGTDYIYICVHLFLYKNRIINGDISPVI